MDEIKNIVSNVIGNLSIKQPENQKKIYRLWENILNEKELEHARIDGIKEGRMIVYVDSPAWLYQFNLKKNRILGRLKSEDAEIKNIRFKIGKVK